MSRRLKMLPWRAKMEANRHSLDRGIMPAKYHSPKKEHVGRVGCNFEYHSRV